MHSILFHVEQPVTFANVKEEDWDRFVVASRNLCRHNATVRTLGETCWLISLQKNLYTFAALLSAAHTRQLTYHVLFFPDEPQWIEALKPA